MAGTSTGMRRGGPQMDENTVLTDGENDIVQRSDFHMMRLQYQGSRNAFNKVWMFKNSSDRDSREGKKVIKAYEPEKHAPYIGDGYEVPREMLPKPLQQPLNSQEFLEVGLVDARNPKKPIGFPDGKYPRHKGAMEPKAKNRSEYVLRAFVRMRDKENEPPNFVVGVSPSKDGIYTALTIRVKAIFFYQEFCQDISWGMSVKPRMAAIQRAVNAASFTAGSVAHRQETALSNETPQHPQEQADKDISNNLETFRRFDGSFTETEAKGLLKELSDAYPGYMTIDHDTILRFYNSLVEKKNDDKLPSIPWSSFPFILKQFDMSINERKMEVGLAIETSIEDAINMDEWSMQRAGSHTAIYDDEIANYETIGTKKRKLNPKASQDNEQRARQGADASIEGEQERNLLDAIVDVGDRPTPFEAAD